MSGKTKVLYSFLIVFFWSWYVQGQSVSISAIADATEIELNGYFNLEFKIENSSGKNFTPPDFSAFNILSGPSQSSSMSIINGSISRSSSYSYTLQPRSVGRFVIGPASIIENGKRYSSSPITITVSKSSAPSSSGQAKYATGKYFVRAEPSRTSVYPGQQLILDYRLYTSVDVNSFRFNNAPEFTGGYAEEMKNYNAGTRNVRLNGKEYTTKIMARMAIYPTASDKITVNDVPITLGISDGNDDPFSSLFGTSSPVPMNVEGVEIKVKPLPVPQPQNFSGAVGTFDYNYTLDKTTLTTDDAVKLTFTLSGNGDMKKIILPVLIENDSIEPYDPQPVDESTEETNNGIVTTKTYTISLIPKITGDITLRIPPLVYFDPTAGRYKTINPKSAIIKVSKGHKPPGTVAPQPNVAAPAEPGFVDAHKEWIMGGILVVLLIILFVYFSRRNRLNRVTTEIIESSPGNDIILPVTAPLITNEPDRRTKDEVTAALQKARHAQNEGNSKDFYIQLHRALAISVASKYKIPFSEFSRQKVWNLTKDGLDVSIAAELERLLSQMELAIYANQFPAVDSAEQLETVKQLIARINV